MSAPAMKKLWSYEVEVGTSSQRQRLVFVLKTDIPENALATILVSKPFLEWERKPGWRMVNFQGPTNCVWGE